MSRGGETGGPTIRDALGEFEREGYKGQFRPKAGGALECLHCGNVSPAEAVTRTGFRRVEGVSDPADMVIINALVCPVCGEHGTAVMKYGPAASPEEGAVLVALASAHATTADAPSALLHPAEAEVPDMPSDFDDDVLPRTPHDEE